MNIKVTLRSTADFCEDLKKVSSEVAVSNDEGVEDLEFGLIEVAAIAAVVSAVADLAELIHKALKFRAARLAKLQPTASQLQSTTADLAVVVVIQGPLSQVTLELSGHETTGEVEALLIDRMKEF